MRRISSSSLVAEAILGFALRTYRRYRHLVSDTRTGRNPIVKASPVFALVSSVIALLCCRSVTQWAKPIWRSVAASNSRYGDDDGSLAGMMRVYCRWIHQTNQSIPACICLPWIPWNHYFVTMIIHMCQIASYNPSVMLCTHGWTHTVYQTKLATWWFSNHTS